MHLTYQNKQKNKCDAWKASLHLGIYFVLLIAFSE